MDNNVFEVKNVSAFDTVLEEGGRGKGTGGKILTVLAVVLILALAAFGGWQYYEKGQAEQRLETLEMTFSEVYLYVNSVTVERFETMVESGADFLIAIGRPDCPYCKEMDPHFISFIQDMGMLEEVYYVNIKSIHNDEVAWPAFKEKYGFFYTPAYMHYSGGELVSYIDGDFTADELREWLTDNRAAFK